jgi:hypothetical protein
MALCRSRPAARPRGGDGGADGVELHLHGGGVGCEIAASRNHVRPQYRHLRLPPSFFSAVTGARQSALFWRWISVRVRRVHGFWQRKVSSGQNGRSADIFAAHCHAPLSCRPSATRVSPRLAAPGLRPRAHRSALRWRCVYRCDGYVAATVGRDRAFARRRRSNRPGTSQANGPAADKYSGEWSVRERAKVGGAADPPTG